MHQTANQTRAGVIYALSAYLMWGVAPLYFKLLAEISAGEILMHRVVWGALFLLALVVIGKHGKAFIQTFKSPKTLGVLSFSGLLLGTNWLLFIWAVNNDHLLEASLGYFINPLVNVLLGYAFLQERFRKLQWSAVGLAVFGVLYLLVTLGTLPWIAMILAVSFGIYGLLRKTINVGAIPGLATETLLVLPICLYFWFFHAQQTNNLAQLPTTLLVQLIMLGVVTIAPLLCFIAAARRLQYATVGFFQYIGPSMMFVMAVWWFDEPLQINRLITFVCVWTGLGLFTLDAIRHYRKNL